MTENIRKQGKISLITGPMFCGKSQELGRRLKRDTIADRKSLVIKPLFDNRDEVGVFKDRDETYNSDAVSFEHTTPTPEKLSQLKSIAYAVDVVAIDEVQFFESWIVEFVEDLKKQGVIVYVAGLDTDYKSAPFGNVGSLACLADEILKLTSVCMVCGDEASRTQRLYKGEPAPIGEVMVVGDNEVNYHDISYEARCDNHFVHPEKVYS